MTRDVAAIVESAYDLRAIERDVQAAHIALRDAESIEEATEHKAASAREQSAKRRVELGQALIQAKKACKHGEWLDFLDRNGIAHQRAGEWMKLAGFVEAKVPSSANDGTFKPPTNRDAGTDKRKRKHEPASTASSDNDPPTAPDSSTSSGSESIVLASLLQTLGVVAREWPGDLNRLASELRRYADKLERRAKERQ